MRFLTRLYLGMTARHVGTDQFGNIYFVSRRVMRDGKPKRFVWYNGLAEASKVPPEWHGWLHYTEDTPPPAEGYARHAWQKDHLPNLTGTIHAYRPSGHLMKQGIRRPATGDYEAWKPES